MVELAIPYFYYSSHCDVSNIQCLPVQHAQIQLQPKTLFTNFNYACKFNKSLKKLPILTGKHKFNVSENSHGLHT